MAQQRSPHPAFSVGRKNKKFAFNHLATKVFFADHLRRPNE